MLAGSVRVNDNQGKVGAGPALAQRGWRLVFAAREGWSVDATPGAGPTHSPRLVLPLRHPLAPA